MPDYDYCLIKKALTGPDNECGDSGIIKYNELHLEARTEKLTSKVSKPAQAIGPSDVHKQHTSRHFAIYR